MAERRIHLPSILLEAFFVVLGVSLALSGNEWRNRVNDQNRADRARMSIIDEVRSNREATLTSRAYHGQLLDSLRHYRAPESPPPSMELFRQGFFKPTTALTTAWDAASATDAISHMDYEDVLTFSKLYAFQSRYERTALEAGTVLYGKIMEDGLAGVTANHRNLSYIIGSFYYLENGLVEEYDRVLSELGEAPADSLSGEPE